jgi:O-antigen/teichoic acid export membrane protein
VTSPASGPSPWDQSGTALPAIARNVGTRYVAIATEAVLGLLVLPFNIAKLGQDSYGLWMVAASITAYFSILDLGYGGALVKFVAYYRARRDADAINDILSTLFVVFAAGAVLAWGTAVVIGFQLQALFHLDPARAAAGRAVLLIIAAQVASGFAFSVFGAVINGFQRYDLNNVVGAASSVVVALVNVVVLVLGGDLVTLVASTTTVRFLAYFVYRHNAYRVFPSLSVRPSRFSLARLKEVTGFSVFVLMLDWAAKVNYSVDAIVIGATLGTAAVAVWTVPQRLIEAIQRMTNQLNDVLFPAVVDSDAANRPDRLRLILVQAMRLSLAAVLPPACVLAVLAGPIVTGWVGHAFSAAVPVAILLAGVVAARVGTATATTVLKGAGLHKLLAWTNLATAAANLSLSLLLVRRFGLTGVAIGTLVPVAASSLLIVFPVACRRVGIPVAEALREAVWPALWPAVVLTAWLFAIRPFVPSSLPVVAAHAAFAGVLYLLLFLRWGLPAGERRFYLSKAAPLLARFRRAEVTT